MPGLISPLGWLLVVGTIPAGVLGLLFEEALKTIFASATVVAIALALNGGVLLAVELLRRKAAPEGKGDDAKVAALSYPTAFAIGVAQCLALIPGFSRTGLTLAGGLAFGLPAGWTFARHLRRLMAEAGAGP